MLAERAFLPTEPFSQFQHSLKQTNKTRVLLCSPGWPGTPRNLPMSVSGVLELKACTTVPGFVFVFF